MKKKLHRGTSCRHHQPTGSGPSGQKICRDNGISNAPFYNRKAKYSGFQSSEVRHFNDLEEKNIKLKGIVTNLTLENNAIKTVLEKNTVA